MHTCKRPLGTFEYCEKTLWKMLSQIGLTHRLQKTFFVRRAPADCVPRGLYISVGQATENLFNLFSAESQTERIEYESKIV